MKTTVEEILQQKGRDVWTISPKATVMDALKLMAEKSVGALVVVHDDQVVGIISERDYARKVILRGRSSINTHVKEIMTDKVYYVDPKTTTEEWLISIGDVVKSIIGEQETEIRQLSEYITGKYI
jgi:CBS domain-containing protein